MSPEFAFVSQQYIELEQFALQVGPQYILPVIGIGVSLALALLVRLPILQSGFILGCSILVLPSLLPLSKEIVAVHPLLPVMASLTIGAVLSFAFGLGRLLVKAMKLGSSTLSNTFSLVLVISLALVSILYFRPELLRSEFPSTYSLLLPLMLSLVLFGTLIACFRFIRAGSILVLWSLVCVLLGAEFFLGKAPSEILPEHLRSSLPFIPDWKVTEYLPDSALQRVEKAAKVLLLDPRLGKVRSRVDETIGDSLEFYLNSRSSDMVFEVDTVGGFELSSFSQLEILKKTLTKVSPDVVILGDWSIDKQPGKNGLGVDGLSEEAAIALRETRVKAAKFPGAKALHDSSLKRLVWPAEDYQRVIDESSPVRVSPENYQKHLLQMVSLAEAANAGVVLFNKPEQYEGNGDSGYDQVQETIAKSGKIVRFPAGREFARRSGEILFRSKSQLSLHGADVLASGLAETVFEVMPGKVSESAKVTTGKEIVVTGKTLPHELGVTIKPHNVNGFYRVLFGANGNFVDDKRFSGSDEVSMRFPISESLRNSSSVALKFAGVREEGFAESKIGTGAFHLNGALRVQSSADLDEVYFNGNLKGRYSAEYPLLAGRVDIQLGEMQKMQAFESVRDLIAWIKRTPWGMGVMVISHGGTHQSSVKLPRDDYMHSFRYIGLGQMDIAQNHCVGFGVAGMSPGLGAVHCDNTIAELRVGDENNIQLKMVLTELPGSNRS